MRDIIRQKIVDALATPVPTFTRRDVRLPRVAGKAAAVIGMRRTGKATFLWQVLADRLTGGAYREGLLFLSFEDDRLADMTTADLGHLEDAFLVRTVTIAAGSERRRMVNPRKVYPIDPGLTLLFDRTGRANLGHALETCVLPELERRGAELAYVRTASGFEVDFLARYPDGQEALIQVCADLDDPATRQREIRALLEAKREHRRATLHLISLAPEHPADLPPEVTVHTASGWLLAPTMP